MCERPLPRKRVLSMNYKQMPTSYCISTAISLAKKILLNIGLNIFYEHSIENLPIKYKQLNKYATQKIGILKHSDHNL